MHTTTAKDINYITLNELDRLFTNVTVTETGCHEWQGARNPRGYGRIARGRLAYPAHRLAYFSANGQIDRLLDIDHLCRNKACVNPEHLELVTRSINSKRMIAAQNRTHCPRGHALEGDNLIKSLLHQGRACHSCDVAGRAARHRKLTGAEREKFIQLNADAKYAQTAVGQRQAVKK